jgi:pimeloyl-ACP methyl ester carboxylesterase
MMRAMPRAKLSDSIEIEYDTFGNSSDPALLLVMGFTAQMTLWDENFCRLLADGGRFVIRFDNRDVGLSTKLDGQDVDMNAILGALFGDGSTEMPPVPYTLSDFSNDAFGVLDDLGIQKAHIVGASMGG